MQWGTRCIWADYYWGMKHQPPAQWMDLRKHSWENKERIQNRKIPNLLWHTKCSCRGGEKYKFCHGVDFWSIWWLRSWPNICQRFLPSSRATRCLSWSMSAPARASKHASDVWPARISRWDGQSWSISADGFKCKQSHVSNKTSLPSLPHSMPVRVLLLLLLLLLLPARKYVPK